MVLDHGHAAQERELVSQGAMRPSSRQLIYEDAYDPLDNLPPDLARSLEQALEGGPSSSPVPRSEQLRSPTPAWLFEGEGAHHQFSADEQSAEISMSMFLPPAAPFFAAGGPDRGDRPRPYTPSRLSLGGGGVVVPPGSPPTRDTMAPPDPLLLEKLTPASGARLMLKRPKPAKPRGGTRNSPSPVRDRRGGAYSYRSQQQT